jgi:hypothetical protein
MWYAFTVVDRLPKAGRVAIRTNELRPHARELDRRNCERHSCWVLRLA